jgi:hypothetical protein
MLLSKVAWPTSNATRFWPHFGLGHFNAALLTDNTTVFQALVLTAQALIVFYLLLDMPLRDIERVLYFESYVVIEGGMTNLERNQIPRCGPCAHDALWSGSLQRRTSHR